MFSVARRWVHCRPQGTDPPSAAPRHFHQIATLDWSSDWPSDPEWVVVARTTLEEHPDATIEEAALVASCLIALPTGSFQEAVTTLRAMADSATRRRRERGAPREQAGSRSVAPGVRPVVSRLAPIQIAFADDLSGPLASSFGISLANAVQIAVAAHPAIRGFPIQINLVDAPCGDPTADAAAATSIVANDQNVGVLGQLCSSGFDQALPIYQSADLVTISGSATSDSLPSFAPTVFNRTAVDDGDGFDAWYATIATLPSDLAWQQAYTVQFGAPPTVFADLYYDAAGLLIRNLQQLSSIDASGNLVIDRTALAQAVRGTTKYRGVSCKITLDPATGNPLPDPTALARCASDAG